MSELSCVTTVSCTQRSRVGSERPRVPLDLVPCTFVVVAIRIALTALGAASVCVWKTFGYFNDMIDPESCGRSSGDQGRGFRQAVCSTAAVSSPPLLAEHAFSTAGHTESAVWRTRATGRRFRPLPTPPVDILIHDTTTTDDMMPAAAAEAKILQPAASSFDLDAPDQSNTWRFSVTGRRLRPLAASPIDHRPQDSRFSVTGRRLRPLAVSPVEPASPFDPMYGQKQVSVGSISPPTVGNAVATTVGTILAQTSPILACDSRPADLFSNKPLTAELNPSTVDLHATLVVCNDQNGDPNAQLRDGTLISSVRSPIGGLVPVPNVQMSNVQMSNESNGTMSVSVCNTDTSVLSISPHESTLGCPPCIFIKNQDQEPKAPRDTALTGNKVDTFMSRQRGGGGEDQHEHQAAVSKPAFSRGEIEPNIALGTPPGIQTGAKAAMSRLYQHLTPRRRQTRMPSLRPSLSLPTLPSHTRIAPHSNNAPLATNDGLLFALRSPQSDEEAKAECLAIRREAASTHIQSVVRARLTRCMSAPAILVCDELVKTSTGAAPSADSGSDSQRNSSSASESNELSPLGAINKANDLAYISTLPPWMRLDSLTSRLHELGIFGQLHHFVDLHLLTIETIVGLTSDQVDGICAASTPVGHVPPGIQAIAQSIRYIQHAASADPVHADLGDKLDAVSPSISLKLRPPCDEPVKTSAEAAPPADPAISLKLRPPGLPKPSEASAGGGDLDEDSCVHNSTLRERGGGRPASAEEKSPMEDDCDVDRASLGDLKNLLASLQGTISQLAAQQAVLADTVASTNANLNSRLSSMESRAQEVEERGTNATNKLDEPATLCTQRPVRKTTQTPADGTHSDRAGGTSKWSFALSQLTGDRPRAETKLAEPRAVDMPPPEPERSSLGRMKLHITSATHMASSERGSDDTNGRFENGDQGGVGGDGGGDDPHGHGRSQGRGRGGKLSFSSPPVQRFNLHTARGPATRAKIVSGGGLQKKVFLLLVGHNDPSAAGEGFTSATVTDKLLYWSSPRNTDRIDCAIFTMPLLTQEQVNIISEMLQRKYNVMRPDLQRFDQPVSVNDYEMADGIVRLNVRVAHIDDLLRTLSETPFDRMQELDALGKCVTTCQLGRESSRK